ncbi:MAG: zinc finger-like domain-containing protein [Acidobacteria bacterium]|nr:zinc finger-like domain-containing protein [Acidobacteriota bacterium]
MSNGMQQCPACNGRRMVSNKRGEMQVCPLCDGTGSVAPQPIRVPFDYVLDRVLAANENFPGVITFDRDAPFEWVWLVATQTGTFTTRFTDQATGRQFENLPVNNANRFGTAQLPFPLVEPYIFAPGTAFGITLVDTTAAPNTVQLVLKGYKLYPSVAA